MPAIAPSVPSIRDVNEKILVSPQSAGMYPPINDPRNMPIHTIAFEFILISYQIAVYPGKSSSLICSFAIPIFSSVSESEKTIGAGPDR